MPNLCGSISFQTSITGSYPVIVLASPLTTSSRSRYDNSDNREADLALLTGLMRQAKTASNNRTGKTMKIGVVSYPSGSTYLRWTAREALEMVEPTLARYYRAFTSWTMAQLTYPENHCLEESNVAFQNNEEDYELVLGIDILYERTIVSIAEINRDGPVMEYKRILHEINEDEISRAVSELVGAVPQNISAAVISGDISDEEANHIKVAVRAAGVPGLADRIGEPSTGYRNIASVGAACRAMDIIRDPSKYVVDNVL